jgi:hypothetical protein
MSRRAVPATLTATPSVVPFPQAVDRFAKATAILLRIQAREDAEEETRASGRPSDLEGDQTADTAGSDTTS